MWRGTRFPGRRRGRGQRRERAPHTLTLVSARFSAVPVPLPPLQLPARPSQVLA